jgi:hypothetical protein
MNPIKNCNEKAHQLSADITISSQVLRKLLNIHNLGQPEKN